MDEDGNLGIDFNPGGLPDVVDERDYPYEAFVGFGVEDIPDIYDVESLYCPLTQKNQAQTLGCGGYGPSYYATILNYIDVGEVVDFSPRSLYAFTHLTNGGSITRDNIMRIINFGIAPESVFPTAPVTEEHLQSTAGWTPQVAAEALKYKGKIATTMTDRENFDLFCNAIYNGYGVVSGVNLSGQGWYSNPIRPPLDGEKIVGHIMYFKGYDTAHPDPAQHYIIAKDSYPSGDKKLYRNYFEAGMVHSAWTIIDEPSDNEDIMDFESILDGVVRAIAGRPSDAGDKKFWLPLLKSGQVTLEVLIKSFLGEEAKFVAGDRLIIVKKKP